MAGSHVDGLFVPEDFVVPSQLVTDSFRLQPLMPDHNASDFEAWTSSIEHIRATPGFEGRPWPDPQMTLADNLGDMHRHADDYATRSGFTYTVTATDGGETIGCVYIYPSGTQGGADVRSWVRADRASLDLPLYLAVSRWLEEAWPFGTVNYAAR